MTDWTRDTERPGDNPGRHESNPRMPWTQTALLLLLIVMIGVQIAPSLIGWFRGITGARETAAPRAITPRGNLADDENSTIELYEKARKSVVHITTLSDRKVLGGLRGMNFQEVPTGTGSGFIWDDRGHVVTNFHVIQGANGAEISLNDQRTFRASLVGAAPDMDLAVLRIEAPYEALQPIPIGTSADLKVGQKVYAIGNPFGLDQSLTTGIISALGREIESVSRTKIHDVIQTDAAINPGNSGGPLLDSAGRLIGVNTAIASPSGVSSGIGFAIPVDEVNRVVPQLISEGKLTRPGLGVVLKPPSVYREGSPEGLEVNQVYQGGGAAIAGIRGIHIDEFGRPKKGDVILNIDGKPVKSMEDLRLAIRNKKTGDKVRVVVQRESEQLELLVTLSPLPGF